MAKSEKKSIEASPEASAGKSKTGVFILGAVVAAAVVAGIFYFKSGPSQPNPNAPKKDPDIAELMKQGPLPDIMLGSADAPNTIVEYASMTCPHCARFHNDVYPKLKEKDIDTGKVKFIFREFPLDGLAVAASMLARCAGSDRFYPMIDGLFETQSTWAVPGEDGKQKLSLIAKQAGFSQESFDKCLADKDLFNKIVAVRQRAHDEFGVDSTPTFFINGKRLAGEHQLKDFEAMFKGASPDGTPPPSG